MRIVFADTYCWIALLNTNGEDYKQVIQFGQTNQNINLVTTEPVIDEILNFFGSKGSFLRGRAFKLCERIVSDLMIQVIPHDANLRKSALTLYRDRLDKGYSFTDCYSMIVMQRMAIFEVLTHDKHFTQEGFTILFP